MNAIIGIIQDYGEALKLGMIGATAVIILFLLAGILRQLKRLNESLKSITGNMQAYFDVILTEDAESEKEAVEETKESSVNRQAEIEALKKREEEEKLFNAVLQEYFS